MASGDETLISRRTLLAGGLVAGAVGLVAACGGSTKTGGSASSGDNSSAAKTAKGLSLVAVFNPSGVIRTGLPQRLVFGLGDANGALVSNGPESLSLTVRDAAGKVVGAPVTSPRHNRGLPRGYYPVPINLAAAGDYKISTTVDGHGLDAAFHVDAPAAVPIPQSGDPMPRLQTPTTANAQGVDPICTNQPQCPLHQVSLATALDQHKPVALLISTPAFCQVGICGPVLDVLLGAQADYGAKIQMIHAEVYRSGAQVTKDPANAALSPTVEAFSLPFEPSLILARADGTIAERLDFIFDQDELGQALTRLAA